MTSDLLSATYEPQRSKVLDYEAQLWQARFSPCGRYLLAAGYDARVSRWTVSADAFEKISAFEGHHGWVQCLMFDPRGERVFTADSWGGLSCWPYAEETPKPLWTQPEALSGWIRDLAISHDGQWIVTAGNDPALRIWSTADGRRHRELSGHPEDVFCVCFHPDGRSLVSGDLKGTIRHWDLETGKLVRELDGGIFYRLDRLQDCGGVRVLRFDAEGRTLVCGGQKTPGGGFAKGAPLVLLLDWETGKPRYETLVGAEDAGFVYDAQFHPGGFLMTASCAMPKCGNLWFWKPGETKPFYTSKDVANCRSVSLHPDGRLLAVVVSESQNLNGRQQGEYLGGSAKIHILQFPEKAGTSSS
jgi:WD40 repeat protein